jgi:PhoH-like ATPase
MKNKTYVLDTNIILSNPYYIVENSKKDGEVKFAIPMVVLYELSAQKSRGGQIGYKARKALKGLVQSKGLFKIIKPLEAVSPDLSNDEIIILTARDHKFPVISMDKDVELLCEYYDVECIPVTSTEVNKIDREYTGVRYIHAGVSDEVDEKLANIYSNPNENSFDLHPNQYLVVMKDNGKEIKYSYYKWQEKMVAVYPYSTDDLKPKNPEQVCALDLLFDDSIPVKILTGVAGSGKTYLATNWAFDSLINGGGKVESKVMVFRNPQGDTDTKQIGFLKGTKEEKMESFFKPIIDNLASGNIGYLMDTWVERDLVEFDSPYFAKGRSFGNKDREFRILVDEAEDLTTKTVRLLGTRIGENAKIVFVGDYKQTEKEYLDNNGLLHLIERSKETPLVGYVGMKEDIRSEASKWFATQY